MNQLPSLRGIAFAAAILFSTLSTQAQSWDFKTGTQGWMINDLNGEGVYTSVAALAPPLQSSTGGFTGGFISLRDPSNYSFFFNSPGSLGDYSTYLGGSLQFSLRTDEEVNWSNDSVVILRGTNNTLLVAALGYKPGSSWTNYNLSLIPQNFHLNNLNGALVSAANFDLVLGSLDSLLIAGEFHAGVSETSGLSAVSFQSASQVTPVPEPSTYGLLGAGALAGLAALRRRRKA